jgi:uncharacterized protein YbjT (DUF2867 family)
VTSSPVRNPDRPFVAVVGASGRQGGAVTRALLSAGARVRALVRDPGSERGRVLADRGSELAGVDFADPDSLRAAFTGVDRVFAMTTMTGPRGVDGEVEQGNAIADAAAAVSVPHLVYSSVGGVERSTGIPHFESKRRVEEHIESLGLSVTFLRPVFFMENFHGLAPAVEDGQIVVRLPLPDGVPLQMIAVGDIGAAAAAILLDPTRVPSGSIEIAGDERTGSQIAAAFGAHARRPARYQPLPLDVFGDNKDALAMFQWLARPPAYQADLAATRALVPGLHDLSGWLSATNWTPSA